MNNRTLPQLLLLLQQVTSCVLQTVTHSMLFQATIVPTYTTHVRLGPRRILME